MTGTQLLVLALLGGAFAGGWFARGAGKGEDGAPEIPADALDDAGDALDAALAVLERVDDGEAEAAAQLTNAVAALTPREERLSDALGDDHPCVVEYRRGREALELLAGDPEALDLAVFDALAQAAGDARRRYALGAEAVAALR